jgi:RNA polymerase sigma-70 factor (ECF subfamily)
VQLSDGPDDVGALRRFGRALARDDRYVLDESQTTRLVDKLIRQTQMVAVGQGPISRKCRCIALYGRFVHLHRRHVRRLALDDPDAGWADPAPLRSGQPVVQGMRGLPLDQREALLLVVLAGFTHREAAEALDIPLSLLVERLGRARERLALASGDADEFEPAAPTSGAPYLKVIK